MQSARLSPAPPFQLGARHSGVRPVAVRQWQRLPEQAAVHVERHQPQLQRQAALVKCGALQAAQAARSPGQQRRRAPPQRAPPPSAGARSGCLLGKRRPGRERRLSGAP